MTKNILKYYISSVNSKFIYHNIKNFTIVTFSISVLNKDGELLFHHKKGTTSNIYIKKSFRVVEFADFFNNIIK